MSNTSLFRKAALEKLASPEQLDTLMQTTTPRAWAALAAFAAVIVMVLLWSVFGQIGTQIKGQGILLRGDAVLAVTAASQGQLARVAVRAGDVVEEGQVLAEVAQPELSLMISQQAQRLAELLAQDEESLPLEQRNLEQSMAALAREQASVARSIEDYRRQVAAIRERVEVQTQLVERGLITRSTLLQTQASLSELEQAAARAGVRLAQISSERTALERQVQGARDLRQTRIDEARRELAQLEARRGTTSVIRSPYAGRVLEVSVDPGNLVAPGIQVLTLESQDKPLEVVLYVPAQQGKRIEPGMPVRVSPSTVRPEEYGFINATVRSVSDFPVSPEGLQRVLRNDSLVGALSGEGPPIEVVATLDRDPSTPSGFSWSSSSGPPTQVYSGTLASGGIVVERRRPISYVLPFVKRTVGAQ